MSDFKPWSLFKGDVKPLKNHKKIEHMVKKAKKKINPSPFQNLSYQSPLNVDPPSPLTSKQISTLRKKEYQKIDFSLCRRLDLHGMTQEGAFQQLQLSLNQAHYQGERYLLVITGKGNFSKINPFSDLKKPRIDNLEPEPQRGVLKQRVPEWLERELSSFVVSYSQAPRHLGGAGALLIHIKRPK